MNGHRVPLAGSAVCVLMALGCVISDNPWFVKKDVAFDPALVGTWTAVGEKESLVFAQGPDDSYIIKEDKAKDENNMAAHLVKVGDARYLDVLIRGKGKEKNQAGHLLMRVALDGDALTLTHMNAEWLAGALDGKKVEAKGTVERKKGEKEPEVHLTGPTEELRDLVAKHAADLFKDGQVQKYARKK